MSFREPQRLQRTVSYRMVQYLLAFRDGLLFHERADGPFEDFRPHPARQRLVEEP